MYQGQYGLCGVELSFFTRKLEAQLRAQSIPWYWHFKTQERSAGIEARAGTHFIPVLLTPENWALHDTIAIGPLLHQRFPEQPVIPDTPVQRSLCFILEDFFNHWLGRICVHTRWCYPENVAWVGPRFGVNTMLNRSIDEPISEAELAQLSAFGDMMSESFGIPVCQNNGVGPEQEQTVRGDFRTLLTLWGNIFAERPFLLGSRPCLADFALAGAAKAHFITDPTPVSWLGQHEKMMRDYTDRVFGANSAEGSFASDNELPDTLLALLDYAEKAYVPYARGSITAGLSGEKHFTFKYGQSQVKARSQRRLEKARLHVRDELMRSEPQAITEAIAERPLMRFYLEQSLVGQEPWLGPH